MESWELEELTLNIKVWAEVSHVRRGRKTPPDGDTTCAEVLGCGGTWCVRGTERKPSWLLCGERGDRASWLAVD